MVERWVAGGATRMLPVAGLLVAAWLLGPGGVQAQSIATLAGGPVGDGAAATSASLNNPQGVAVDASGNLLVADVGNHRIRRIAAGTGIITTVAGNGTSGFGGDGGPATNANLSLPRDVAVDASGNLFVVDQGNQRIRRIAAGTGIITTVAGNGTAGFGGDGGLATAASLHNPRGIAVDASGNLVVADTDNHRLRRIAAGTGIITTLAGTGTAGFLGDGGAATNASLNKPVAVAFDASGNLSVADSLNQRIRRIAAGTGIITTVAGNGSAAYGGDGGAATSASLNFPRGLRFDASGNLFVADTENARIRKIAAGTGIITTTAGTGTAGFSGDGGAATSANLRRPTGLAVDAGGNLLLADFDNRRLRRVAAGTGIITTVGGGGTFAGDGGVASSAVMSSPQGLAIDPSQNVYLADQGNQRIRKIAAGTGIITTVAGTGASGFGGDGGAATGASLANPEGLAVDASGHLFIADTVNHRIRRIAAGTGIITTVAGNGTFGFGGDGGAATSANLYYPTGVALDASGNLFVADWGNQRIRKIAAGTGIITTVAGNGSTGFSGDGGAATGASLNFPRNLTVDASGNVVLADTGNHRLRRIAAGTGIITTVAGNGTAGFNGDGIAATSASLNNPIGLAVDAAGNLLVADTLNQRIRKIATGTGIITTAAGNGTLGFSGDGGIATSASLYNPFSLAFDTNGNFNFPDLGNDRIRQVTPGATATTTSVVASANPSTFAQNVTFTATVTGSAPTGSVTFRDGATVLCTVSLAGASALCATSTLSVGSHSMTAAYAGDANNAPSTSPVLTQTVTAVVPGAPVIGPATAGNAQASVAFTAPAFTGGVPITSYTATCNPGNKTATGAASPLVVTGLTNGTAYTCSVTATNTAGSGPASALSNSVTPTAAASSTSVVASVNPSAFAQSVTFTATVSGSAPTGSVTFRDGATVLCTVSLAGASALCATSTLSVGSHSMTAAYAGDANNAPSTSPVLTQTVTAVVPGAPVIGLATAGNAQASVAFTAPAFTGGVPITSYTATCNPGNVTVSGPASPLVVTGLVNGTAYTCSVKATNTAGSGPASALSNSVTPTAAASSTSVVASVNPSAFAQSVTFTATVSGSAPTGSVTFRDGATVLCTVSLAGASALCATSTLSVGSHSMTAAYAGDANNAPSTSPVLTQTVTAVVPGAPVIGPATAGNAQASVAFTAPAFTGGVPITSYTATCNPGNKTATGAASPLVVTGLTNGTAYTCSVTATNTAGSGPASALSNSVTPTAAASSTSVVASVNPSAFAQSVTFTATVSGSAPTGNVTFRDGATVLCTVPLAGPTALCASSTLTVGSHSVTAAYAGDANNGPSTSPVLTQTVTAVVPGAPIIGLTTAGNGQASVAFTAPAFTGGVPITSYTATCNPGNETASGLASPLLVTGLTNGTAYTCSVKATNTAGTGAASALSNSVTPTAAASSTSVVASVNPSAFAQSVIFTATVSGSAPTGNVTFRDGATVLCTVPLAGASAQCASSTLTVGSHSMTAAYAGDANNAPSTSPVLTQNVTAVAPGAPVIGLATAGNGQASVAFTAPAFTGGVPITSYTATCNPGNVTVSGAASPLVVTGLVNGTAYTCSVKAINTAGSGPASALSNSVTPTSAASSTSLVASVNPSAFAQSVTFTATVSGNAPSGSVTFRDGATVLCTVPLAGPTALCASSTLTVGSHSVTAAYAGDANNAPSTSPVLTQIVTAVVPGAPFIGLATAGNAQASVAFTAPTFTGGMPITSYTATCNPGNKTATGVASPLVVTGLTNGTAYTCSVKASNAAGSGPASALSNSVTPAAAASSTSVVASVNPSAFAQNVTFTATVSGNAPSGSVSFRDGVTVLCTMPLAGASAACAISTLTVGSHSVTAAYAGDANNGPSTSPVLTQNVTAVVPGAPTGVSAQLVLTGIQVSFTPPIFTGGVPITSYTATCNPGNRTASGAASPIVVTGLTTGVAYTCTTRANNGAGMGAASAPSNSITYLLAMQRSFVASYGNDTNLCDAFAPCRSLAQALAHTAPGGEVVVLDSADYGAVTIAQSVSVVAATGIYAGVSGLPGGNAITIAAGPSDSIVLRGLSIGSAGGNHGILFTSGAALYVENTVVRGFTPPGLANVAFQPVGPAKLFVKDSRIQSGAIGLKVVSAGDPVGVVVDNTRFEGNGTGVLVAAEGELALRNVVVASGTADGINLAAANGQPLTVAVDRALVTDNAGAGLTVGGVNQVAVTVKGSTLRGNGSYGVYVQGGGTPSVVRLDRNVITRNATGIATAGANARILSLGNNTIEGNGSNGSVTGSYSAK